jgi:putative transposase
MESRGKPSTSGAAKYGGLEVNEAKRLHSLEDENRRLKRVVADQALNIQVLKDLLGKK